MRSPIAPRTASGSRPVVAQLLTVSLLALALAGCKTLDESQVRTSPAGRSSTPTQRHPIMVSQQPSTMNAARCARLAGADPGAEGPGRHVPGALPRGRCRQQQAGDRRAERLAQRKRRRARRWRDTAIDHGLRFLRGQRRHRALSRRRDAGAPIRLSYLRYVAEGPECGRWTTNLAEDYRNLPYPNFGCAQQRNLAAQIANPADLLGPRTMEPADQERRAVVFDKYRQGKPTGAEKSPDERIQVKTAN